MPITSSAKKALRASKKKRVFNLRRKSEMEQTLKDFRKLVLAKKKVEAEKLIPALYKAVDKAVKTDFLKPNKASRTKARAMAAIKRIK